MFSKLASELEFTVNEFINPNKICSGKIHLASCKIDNVQCDVDVAIYFNKHNATVSISLLIETSMTLIKENFDIDSHQLYSEKIIENKKINEINYEEFYEKVYVLIPTLKISKKRGKFITSNNTDDELVKLFTHPNVELRSCCVCLDMCGGVYIECGHDICIECITQLKPKKDEEDEDHCSICCPLCRHNIG